ncbi:MAG: hypothetical protein IPL40_00745 [Proteobacteria bacterium]|nr:hypothetical protein [Pseudomonadota bacterium]
MRREAWAAVGLGVVLALALGGCGTAIGDGCSDNVDCATDGTRVCDLTQPRGYCTVLGCSARSCPDSAVCVAFYSANPWTAACNPLTEDAVGVGVVPSDDCNAEEVCLSSGRCALRAAAQRFCMKSCRRDGDCRGDYACRATGLLGAEAVRDPERPSSAALRFCGQRPPAAVSADGGANASDGS